MTLFALAIITCIFSVASGVGAQASGGELSIFGITGQVELEVGLNRHTADVGSTISPDTRIRLAPESAVVISGQDLVPIRVMGQGAWRVADLIAMACAQREAGLLLLGLAQFAELTVATIDELIVALDPATIGFLATIPADLITDPDGLLELYQRLQIEYEPVVREVISYLEGIEPNGELYAKAVFVRAHLLIDHFAYADALESLGHFLRRADTSPDDRQHAYLLQAVGYLGLGNRGSARYLLDVVRELDPQSEVARAADFFLGRLQ